MEREIEKILKKNGVKLGEEGGEVNLISHLEINEFAAAIVENYLSHNAYVANPSEDIYIIHKHTGNARRIDGGMVEFSRWSGLRYKLQYLEEREGIVTLKYSFGDEEFKRKFRLKTTTTNNAVFKEE